MSAFERAPAEIVVLDEESSASPSATVIHALRRLERAPTEIIVLRRDWTAGASALAALGARELPKPIPAQILGSVLKSAGERARASESEAGTSTP